MLLGQEPCRQLEPGGDLSHLSRALGLSPPEAILQAAQEALGFLTYQQQLLHAKWRQEEKSQLKKMTNQSRDKIAELQSAAQKVCTSCTWCGWAVVQRSRRWSALRNLHAGDGTLQASNASTSQGSSRETKAGGIHLQESSVRQFAQVVAGVLSCLAFVRRTCFNWV